MHINVKLMGLKNFNILVKYLYWSYAEQKILKKMFQTKTSELNEEESKIFTLKSLF